MTNSELMVNPGSDRLEVPYIRKPAYWELRFGWELVGKNGGK